MGFVQRSLLPGETIVFNARLSLMPLVFAFLSLVLWSTLTVLLCLAIKEAAPFIALFGLVIVFAVLLNIARVLDAILTTVIVVTNQRLLAKRGWLARTSIEVLLTKLESVEVSQGIGGRLFGYGTIRIHGTGSSKVPFRFVKSPLSVRRACVEAADKIQRTASIPAGPALAPQPSGSVPLFEVKIADPITNSERWIEVRAATMNQAKELAIATGAIVGDARLKSIS